MSTDRQQLLILLRGYATNDGTIRPGTHTAMWRLLGIAAANGITVYRPGEYHQEQRVVIADGCYAYAVGADGEVETIAG